MSHLEYQVTDNGQVVHVDRVVKGRSAAACIWQIDVSSSDRQEEFNAVEVTTENCQVKCTET